MSRPLVQANAVSKHFPLPHLKVGSWVRRRRPFVRAVHRVSLSIDSGETLGLAGETGCGKSTLGRLLLRLYEPTVGTVAFAGQDLTSLPEGQLRPLRSRMQIIFQDPYSSLNPRHTLRQILSLPLRLHSDLTSRERKERITQLLRRVGLQPEHTDHYPHQFSGGQRQRIGIARALAVEPEFIVADEPVSALDVSVQAQILNLLRELQNELGLTMLFISHDLAVLRYVSERIAVMYLGTMVEIGAAEHIAKEPLHPYTKCLLQAVPKIGPGAKPPRSFGGELPSAANPPTGCPFHPRCSERITETCRLIEPELRTLNDGRQVACHLVE